jgi:hypothetical protein
MIYICPTCEGRKCFPITGDDARNCVVCYGEGIIELVSVIEKQEWVKVLCEHQEIPE